MNRIPPPILAFAVVGCQAADPHAGASVGPRGASAGAGVDAGRLHAAVGTAGAHGSVDLADTRDVDVGIGIGGPGVSVGMGDSPVKVRMGPHGLRLGT